MNTLAIPGAREVIRATSLEMARKLAQELLELKSSEEINARLAESEWYARPWLGDGESPSEPQPFSQNAGRAGLFH